VDRSFNCGQFLQSLNRIHRVGLPEGAKTRYWIPFIDCAIERSVDERLKIRTETMYEFLGDDTPTRSIDWDETDDITDSSGELSEAFGSILSNIDSSDAS
jgi:hypothetical protein